MAKHIHTQNLRLAGTIYLNKNRYWWKVQLPGEPNSKFRPLKSLGSRFTTTDYAVGVECAKQLLQQHLFQQRIPHQGQSKIIPDLVRAHMEFAKKYYVGPDGRVTRELLDIQYALAVPNCLKK